MRKFIKFILLFSFGLIICASPTGMKDFPDLDQKLPMLLGHRSIITHSILFPIILYFIVIKKKIKINPNWLIFLSGLFMGMGIHLIADLFPKTWNEYSFIKIPGDISVGYFSIIWIGSNAIASIYFAKKLIKKIKYENLYDNLYLSISLLTGILYSLNERNNQITIFLTFVILFILLFLLEKKRPNYF